MSTSVFVLGGHQTDFSQNWTRAGHNIFDLMATSLQGACAATAIDPAEIGVGHVGNFVGELFTGQGMLGGFFGHAHPDLAGMPVSRHEGACASGSLAVLAAMADIESGRYDVAMVTGIELMRNVSGKTASDYLGAAAWVGEEATGGRIRLARHVFGPGGRVRPALWLAARAPGSDRAKKFRQCQA